MKKLKQPQKRILLIIFLSLLFLFLLALFCHLLFLRNYRLTDQNSLSMPQGWYWITPIKFPIDRNETLVFEPPAEILLFLNQRGWLVPNDWLMKRAAGLPGDWVCIKNNNLWINTEEIAPILTKDKKNLPLPHLSFCRKLAHNEYFLISTYITRSFDSRYFGCSDHG
jgi:type IV secretory pathway protease TraF